MSDRDLDANLGPLLVGTLINVTLLGAMIIQVHTYVGRFWERDEKWLKATVLFLLIADTLNSALDAALLYQYIVAYLGNHATIRSSNWVFNSDAIMTAILSCICQTFFAWRIKQLSRKNWAFITLLVSIFIQFLMGMATTIAATVVKVWIFDDFQKFRIIVIIWSSFSSVTNITLAVTLLWYLRSRRTGYDTMDTALARITKLTMETGLLTAIWASIDLILYLIFRNSLHLIFNLPLKELYTNSLMSSLNSRDRWRHDIENDRRIALQKVPVGESDVSMPIGAQRVIWTGMDNSSNQSGYPQFGHLKGLPDNGILVTSSTVIHRDRADDEDQSDVQISEDPHLTTHDNFVNPSSSSRLVQSTIQSTQESHHISE